MADHHGRQIERREPPLARPGAWAGLWRRMAVKAALAADGM